MASSIQRVVSDGTLATLPLSIDYFDRTEISVYFDDSLAADAAWGWVGLTDSTITFSPAVPIGVEVLVKRITDTAVPRHVFSDGAQFNASSLDENTTQALRAAQEIQEGSGIREIFNDINMHGHRIKNVASAVSDDDAIPLGQYLADTAGAKAALAAAEALFDAFDDRYLGAKAADPVADNDGNGIATGALYYNTVVGELRAFNGVSWQIGVGSSLNSKLFSGTGVQVAFTLDSIPSNETNTQVYVNGVYQQKDTYSLAGAVLTFSEAPPVGTDNIEVMTVVTLALGTVAAGNTSYVPTDGVAETNVQSAVARFGSWIKNAALAAGAAAIGFLQAGVGAALRSVQDKLRDTASVKDFGAVGDGVVDDTAAINAALAAHLVVEFPPGTYKKTGTVAIRGGAHLLFRGATVTQADDLVAFSANTTEWRFSGTGTVARSAGLPVALVASSVGLAIGSAAARYGVYGDITFLNFANAGVLIDGGGVTTTVARSRMAGVTCRANWSGYSLLAGYSAEYITFTACLAVDNVVDGVYGESANLAWIGGAVTGNGNGWHLKHPASGVNPHHGTVIGCHINHNINRQLWAEGVAFGMDFVGCHFYDNGNATTGRIRLENSRGVNITGGEIGCGVEGVYDGVAWTAPNYGFNRISGNFFVGNGAVVTGAGFTREKLMVSANFNQSGPSIYNDVSNTFAATRLAADSPAQTATANLGALGTEVYDNRNLLAGNFVANPGGWFTMKADLNLLFTTAPTTEYLMFGRDDAAGGTFTELHRVRVADLATGLTASISASYDFVVSGGGQLAMFLVSPGGNNFTVKAGSMVSFRSMN